MADIELDEVLTMYEAAAASTTGKKVNLNFSEKEADDNEGWFLPFLLSTTLTCSNSQLNLEVGISTSEKEHFNPAVRIHVNDNTSIYLQSYEWHRLIENLTWLLNGYFENTQASHLRFICCKNIVIGDYGDQVEGAKIIVVTKDSKSLYLTKNNIRELCHVNNLFIAIWLDKLEKIGFAKYYDKILYCIQNLKLQNNSVEDVLPFLCKIGSSVENYCLSQYTTFYMNKFLNDFNKINI